MSKVVQFSDTERHNLVEQIKRDRSKKKNMEKKLKKLPKPPVPIQHPVKCVDGMELIEYCWIALEDINDKNCNWGRFRGVKTTGVEYVQNLIKTREYNPTLYEPPVVDQNYNLIAGKHRYDGHDGENETFMWCARCDFDNDDARNAYALDENMRKTFKTDADQGDFVFSIGEIVKRGENINPTKNSVKSYIATKYPTLPKGWLSRSALAEKILEVAGIDFVPVEIMLDEKIVAEYYNEYGIDILGTSNYILKKLTGKKDLKRSDRWIRLQRDQLDAISKGEVTTVIVTFTDANSQDIPKLRKTCLEFKSDMVTNALKLTTGKEKSKLGNVKFVFTKQLPTDEGWFNYVD
jgi:hypothetical protein